MKGLVGAVAIGAVLRLPLGEPASFVTVAQSEAHRGALEAPSVAISDDGRYVAFTSCARLAPADTNRQRDIYVLDRNDAQVTLESITPEGRGPEGDSVHPSISGDGQRLAYETQAKVMLRDRRAGSTRTIANGRDPSISRDGRFVVFTSSETTLVKGSDANSEAEDIFLFDLRTDSVHRVSVDNHGIQPTAGSSVAPGVSGDGRYVVFASTAPFNSSGHKEVSHVYVRDVERSTTTRIGLGWRPAISADGRLVAFVSASSNLVAGDRNNAPDIFLFDRSTGSTELISRGIRGGSGNGASGNPALSADGRWVIFQSEASDLLCSGECSAAGEDINLLWDVFLYDRQTRATTRLSSDPAGGWMEASAGPAINGDGGIVAFSSRHPLDAADESNDFDLFIRQRFRR